MRTPSHTLYELNYVKPCVCVGVRNDTRKKTAQMFQGQGFRELSRRKILLQIEQRPKSTTLLITQQNQKRFGDKTPACRCMVPGSHGEDHSGDKRELLPTRGLGTTRLSCSSLGASVLTPAVTRPLLDLPAPAMRSPGLGFSPGRFPTLTPFLPHHRPAQTLHFCLRPLQQFTPSRTAPFT